MPIVTVRDLLVKSFKVIHVLGQGEPMNAEDASDALDTLNDIIEHANADKLLSYYSTNINIPLVSQQTAYTIGPASFTPNVIATRPVDVLSAFSGRIGTDQPVLVLSKDDYNNIQRKTVEVAGWIQAVYYEAAFPVATLYVYPEPVDTLTTLTIVVRATVAPYATLEDLVSLPPTYRSWLQYKTAERLAPEYGVPFTDKMRLIMLEIEGTLRRNNIKPFPIAGTGIEGIAGGERYNVFTDTVSQI